MQSLLSHATLFARVPNTSSLGIGRFIFSSPFNEFVNNSIDVRNEDMLYNWIERASMFISKANKLFKATKKMHLSIFQALINVCSKTRSFVVNLSPSTSMCSFSKNSFTIFASKILFDHLSPYKQHNQGLPKPWAPHHGFGVGYRGFYKGVRTSRWSGHAWTWCQACLMPSMFIASILSLMLRNTLGHY